MTTMAVQPPKASVRFGSTSALSPRLRLEALVGRIGCSATMNTSEVLFGGGLGQGVGAPVVD